MFLVSPVMSRDGLPIGHEVLPGKMQDIKTVALAGGDSFSGMADAGGYGIYCELSAKDMPIIVFETGLTEAHDAELAPGVKANEPIRDEIAKVTGTFMYDRAGLGHSRRRSGSPLSGARR